MRQIGEEEQDGPIEQPLGFNTMQPVGHEGSMLMEEQH